MLSSEVIILEKMSNGGRFLPPLFLKNESQIFDDIFYAKHKMR